MAEKKGMILYLNAAEQWNMLTDVQAGVLIKALLRYGTTGEKLETDDGMLAMAFSFMAAQMDRDGEKWDTRCKKNAENARKRWEQSHPDECDDMQSDANACERMRMDAKHANNNNNNNNDNDNDNDNEKNIKIAHTRNPRTAPASHSVENVETQNTSYAPLRDFPLVKLTRDELKQLKSLDLSATHKSFDAYLASMTVQLKKGREYGSHFEMIRKWMMQDGAKISNSSVDMSIVDKIMNPYGA